MLWVGCLTDNRAKTEADDEDEDEDD